ncbi:PREDICTED: ubinuclein-1-like isoform X3 [Nelumbo nucifera]|uniref:Ubinuclein-1-like isoform X3 n=1 Tax=Nelumbo nucifera TaxID=4432 RepID=A0A1U8AQY8_NELNU|nr:PREDICTED: ubinuclein-1-like isoform X3 [Nelumbo nucifera]
MEEENVGGANSARVSSSFAPETGGASSSTYASKNGRWFTVELRPGETTIVSWKKLIKEANKASQSTPASEAPSGAHPALESRLAPGQPAEGESKDAPPGNRFSAVIEKIERLYVGKESSDEEELDGVPDDDQYDTEDSFIDDTELDEYFQVDKSSTKHNGFFVNRGKLERINEPVASPDHQPKKRRRKDLAKSRIEKDGENVPNKHTKDGDHIPSKNAKLGNVRMKAAARTAPLGGTKSSSPSQSLAAISEYYEDEKVQNQLNAPVGLSKKKSTDSSTKPDNPSSAKILNKDASVFPEAKDIERQRTGTVQHRELGSKLKVSSESSDALLHLYRDKNTSSQIEPQSNRQLNDMNELELSTKVRQKEKNCSSQLPDLNSSVIKYPVQTAKTSSMHVKEGSTVRPKGTMLERAIRELEKMVAESRPPIMEVQDADASSQAVKRRLPREVKQKLAKVARLASSQGKISEELINRLMSILGHLVQLKTLKRNLKEMVELGLTAKQAKDDRFQQIKKEIVEMIKVQALSLKSKASEPRDGASDDFQEPLGSEEKGVKGKYCMDDAMEDKLCDLYDLFVEGMDEDKGPQIRKLYVELAELWPNGSMDNHGIKSAVCRAKERKRAMYSKHKIPFPLHVLQTMYVQPIKEDQEKIRRKKLSSTPRTEEIVHGETSTIAQPRFLQERLVYDPSSHVLTSPNRMTSNMTAASQHISAPGRVLNSSTNGLNLDRPPKQEKVKDSSGTFLDEVRGTDGKLVKKKLKRKPESIFGEVHYHADKLSIQKVKEKHKFPKQAGNQLQKPSVQSTGLPSSEQPS